MKKRKKKQKRDFSVLIYVLVFCAMAGFMLLLMFSGVGKNDENTVVQEKQEVTTEQPKPAIEKPTLGYNIQNFETYIF